MPVRANFSVARRLEVLVHRFGVSVILDGKALGKPQANKLFALNKVNRGTHKIAVQVMDAEGNNKNANFSYCSVAEFTTIISAGGING